ARPPAPPADPKLLSWLISFVIVAKFWLNHHHVLALARHADYGMVWLNSIFLMFQSFIPFPTAMMGEYPANPLAVSIFGLVMALNTLLFIALHGHIVRRLVKPDLAGTQDPHIIRKSFVGRRLVPDRRRRRVVQCTCEVIAPEPDGFGHGVASPQPMPGRRLRPQPLTAAPE